MRKLQVAIGVLVIAGFFVFQSLFIVQQTESAAILRFGAIQRIEKTAGLKFKLPIIEEIQRFDNRLLRIDVRIESMPDKDQQFLEIDAYVRYKILDPERFLLTLRDEITAQGRIGNIVISEIRRVVAANEQTTIIGGVPEKQVGGVTLVSAKTTEDGIPTREYITRQVLAGANAAVSSVDNNFGIIISDVRIKAADFPLSVEQSVYTRMRTERQVQAQKLRAEGEEENLTIRSLVDREITVIRATSEKEANELRGAGEAEAIKIFATALEQDPEFYTFTRTLEAYKKTLPGTDTTVVLSSDSDLLKYLETPNPQSSLEK